MFLAWRVAGWLASRLPLPLSHGLAAVVAAATFVVWPRGRRAMLANFRIVLGDPGRRRVYAVALRSLVNYCRYIVDFARLPGLSERTIQARTTNPELYAEITPWLENCRGVLIVCFHFGNWDLGAAGAAVRGVPMMVVAEPFDDPRLDREIRAGRERLGMKVIPMDEVGPSLYRRLRRGGVLALLIDRPLPPGQGVPVDWFGSTVNLPDGPARIALRTGAKVIPAAFARTPGTRDTFSILADLDVELPDCADRHAAVRELTQRMVDSHARFVATYPDNWYMFRRFGRKP